MEEDFTPGEEALTATLTSPEVDAASVFVQKTQDIISKDDLSKIIGFQRHMLGRFEKTNEMLLTITELASRRYEVIGAEFKSHTSNLVEMKKDLDQVFRRIRNLKTVVAKKYPKEFKMVVSRARISEEEEEDQLDDDVMIASSSRPAQEDAISLNAVPMTAAKPSESSDDDTQSSQKEMRERAKSQS